MKEEDFKNRCQFFLKNNKECTLKIKNIPNSEKEVDKCSDLILGLNVSNNEYEIEAKDKKGVVGFKVEFDGNGEHQESTVKSNIFPGNRLMEIRVLTLSLLGFKTDKVSDASSVFCSHQSCFRKNTIIPLHTYRLLMDPAGKSWYYKLGYTPECGTENYEKSIEFLRNLTLIRLDELNKNCPKDFKLAEFHKKVSQCFHKSIQQKVLRQEESMLITFSVFAERVSKSENKRVHQIFHSFIDIVDEYAFLSHQKLIEEEEEMKNTEYQYFFHLCSSGFLSKKIKIMHFNDEN